MAQDKKLPEGTDKIISGASTSGTGSSGTGSSGTGASDEQTITDDTTLVTEREIEVAGAGTSGPEENQSRGNRERMMEKVRSGGEKLSGQAAGKARDLVGQGLERSGEALSNVGKLVSDTASGLDERLGAEYGDYARRAAEAIDRTAQSLRSKDPDELIDDTREFVRKSPGMALAGAAIVGFALARLVKTGLDAAREDDGKTDRGQDGGGRA